MSSSPSFRVDLTGHYAVVTGAATGIGRATALALAEAGAEVTLVDLAEPSDAAATLAHIQETGCRASYLQADLSSAANCHRVVETAAGEMGRLDILVNVAGGAGVSNGGNRRMAYADFVDITEADFDEIVNSNLKSAFFCCQAAAKVMLAQGGGKIINFGSEQAYVGFPLLAHYASAKAGILTLTRSLALALAPDIKVNTVSPGPVATESMRSGFEFTDEVREQIPLKRWGVPEEIAQSVLFLASSAGDFYTGQVLDPNGGTAMP
jgi:NAD(P)-dependent dehydrogenase (short-subunit alcohol dehydrogenase family)